MAFNIGSILGSVGGAILNPIGAALGKRISGEVENFTDRIAGIDTGAMRRAAQRSATVVAPAQAPAPMYNSFSAGPAGQTGSEFTSAFLGGLLPAAGRALPVASAMIRGGRIAPILAKARANLGQPITSRKLVSLIRQFGWATVAGWAGLEVAELLQIWQHQTRRRRRRWTAKDMTRARAYVRHLERCERELNSLRPRSRSRSKRTTTSGHHITNVK